MTLLDESHPAPVSTRDAPDRTGRRKTLIRTVAVIALVALLAIAPYAVNITTILTLEQVAAFAVFAVAANLLVGQAGLVSFGQGVFFGLGGFFEGYAEQDALRPIQRCLPQLFRVHLAQPFEPAHFHAVLGHVVDRGKNLRDAGDVLRLVVVDEGVAGAE